MDAWHSYLEAHQSRFVRELTEFLSIPSISSLPEHQGDVKRAADWVAARLVAAGMEDAGVKATSGGPAVYADWLHAPGKPTVLIYGHFDTQPVDPIELWTDPPFEPVIRNGRIYARGASDDKGNMLSPILALEALLHTEGALPINVKCLFEGEEEIGSPSLPAFIDHEKELLACDFVLSADGGQWSEEQPAILLSLRGLCALQIDVHGAREDVHSGLYGGAIQNPIHALVNLLDSMHDAEGRVAIDGFYDEVIFHTEEERSEISRIPFDADALKQKLGLSKAGLFGEKGFTPYEQTWIRPTLEMNGIWGGFQGEGTKTVIPAVAHAKITCRLVSNQHPDRIMDLIETHLERHRPPGVRIRVRRFAGKSPAYEIPADHPGNRVARDVLQELYGREPYYVRGGGSIPVCNTFYEKLRVHSVNFAFALDDENFHAPDEFFRLSSFEKGQRAYCLILRRLESLDTASLQLEAGT